MRMTERLKALKEWTQINLCQGREMKTFNQDMDYTKIVRQEPRAYIGFTPTRPSYMFSQEIDPECVAPSIIIMPMPGDAKIVEEKRFDRFKNVERTQELGQWFNVCFLFSVYEPGIRLPGFRNGTNGEDIDVKRILEGTEEGVMTLYNWMDDCVTRLLTQKIIPHSDLSIDEPSLRYGPFQEMNTIADKRPLFYGYVDAQFNCHANDGGEDNEINKLLI